MRRLYRLEVAAERGLASHYRRLLRELDAVKDALARERVGTCDDCGDIYTASTHSCSRRRTRSESFPFSHTTGRLS